MLRKKLKGGALYIALIISILIGTILSVFILLSNFNNRETITRLSQTQLQWNLESAINLVQSESFVPAENYQWKKNEFNDDSIKIKKLQWGAFVLISAETKNRHQYLQKTGLFGINSFKDTALMVNDFGRPVNLAGTISFNGYCYLPKGAYKTTFIEGQGFSSTGDISGNIKSAPAYIPEPGKQFIEALESCTKEISSTTDSIITNIDVVQNKFTAKTAIYQTSNLRLERNNLKGNIKIIINNEVIIDKDAHLEDVLIIAKKVRIRKEFKGSLQVIASDSIIVEENSVLNYPSSLIVHKKENTLHDGMGTISISKNCRIEGAILCLSSAKAETPNVIIAIDKECEVNGLIYSSGYAGIQGKITDNIFAKKLLLKTPSSVYENHLLNCEIDSKKYSNIIAVPALFENSNLNRCVKWL